MYPSTLREEELKNKVAADVFGDYDCTRILGAVDCARIAFVPYHEVVDLFYQNDFNWNVAPSDETTREFGLVLDRVRPLLDASLRVFPFDFLNGSFDDLPEGLRAIVRDPERRKKLVVFINPPYAEAGNKGQMTARGKNKSGVTFENATYEKYHERLGTAARELAALFLTRLIGDLRAAMKELAAKIAPKVREHGFLR